MPYEGPISVLGGPMTFDGPKTFEGPRPRTANMAGFVEEQLAIVERTLKSHNTAMMSVMKNQMHALRFEAERRMALSNLNLRNCATNDVDDLKLSQSAKDFFKDIECYEDGAFDDGHSPLIHINGTCAVQGVALCDVRAPDSDEPEIDGSDIEELSGNQKGTETAIVGRMGRAKSVYMEGGLEKSQGRRSVHGAAGGAKARRKCFADANGMKEQVRQALHKKKYNVHDYYHATGCAQKVAKSEYFENFTLAVIAVNAIWISIDTDLNDAEVLVDATPPFVIMENLFCAYFTFEWVTRFCAFRRKRDGVRDAWFVFDSCLMLLMWAETWILSAFLLVSSAGSGTNATSFGDASILRLFRLLRLTRISRVAKLLRLTPEILILIKGMVVASRSVFFAFALLIGFIYVFAVAFVIVTVDTPVGTNHFRDVPAAMATLLLRATLPDWADVVYEVARQSLWLGFCYMGFILLSSITLMNMLVGILVEVVAVVSSVEKEQMNAEYVRHELASLLMMVGIDADNPNVAISSEDVQELLLSPEAARAINDVGVDAIYLIDFCDFLFKSHETITFANFVEIVMQLRGGNAATVKDVADLRKLIVQDLFSKLQHMEDELVKAILEGKPPDCPTWEDEEDDTLAVKKEAVKAKIARGSFDNEKDGGRTIAWS